MLRTQDIPIPIDYKYELTLLKSILGSIEELVGDMEGDYCQFHVFDVAQLGDLIAKKEREKQENETI